MEKQKKPNFIERGGFINTVKSAKALATGGSLSRNFFDGEAEQLGVNYKRGGNPFESGRGSLLAIRAKILGAAGAAPAITQAIIDAISQIVETTYVEIAKSTTLVHRIPLADLMPSLPRLIGTEIVQPVHKTIETRLSAWSYVFRPPVVFESSDFTSSIKTINPAGQTVPAALDTYLLVIEMQTLEYPKN